jgi:trimeric autotransporter adhesin
MNIRLKNGSLRAVLISALTLFYSGVYAQKTGSVGIGTTSPDNSAILDLSSNTKGFLLPRMTLQERTAIVNPAKGLIVYQTNLISGAYIYDGKDWSAMSSTEAKLTSEDNSIWQTVGNAGLNANDNFIGTTDKTSIIFRVNNLKSGMIDFERGNLFMGYRAGQISSSYNSVVLGALAMQKANTSGNNNAMGFQSMFNNESGNHNIAIGTGSLHANLSGNNNVAIGSLSGYKAIGTGNVFLGYQSGYGELGNDLLVVSNSANRTPLIYGNFENSKIGFNTQELTNTVNINSTIDNNSGLRFQKMNSNSPVSSSNGKVLTLNSNGDVILTSDLVGTAVAAATFWQAKDNNIENINAGTVAIKSSLSSPNIDAYALNVGNGGLKLPFINQADKILGLDATGKVIAVNMPSSTVTGPVYNSSGIWSLDNEGNAQANLAYGMRVHMYGITLDWGGIRFSGLNSEHPPFESNGLALSLDIEGNVILTKNADGGSGGSATSVWDNFAGSIRTPNEEKVVIGKGINFLPEGYSLYVKKGILAERVRVAVANSDKWADYVFSANYRLMPLKEVETFIKANNHLPNVLSAEEIAEGGIDLAEMAAKQMEKIEELTLYVIEQNKRIENLEKEIATLK